MTYQQADQLHEQWLKVEFRDMTLTDFMGHAMTVQHIDGDAEVLFPPGWEPPELREKAKAKGAA